MKRNLLLLAAALLALCSCGPRKVAGQEETVTRGIQSPYETISIKGNVDVVIDDEANVMTLTGDKNLLKLLNVKVGKKAIKITATAGLLRDASSPRVKVTLPFSPWLNNLKMEGTSSFEFGQGDIGPKLTVETKGANYVHSVMALVDLVIRAEGSDRIMIDCVCDNADIDAKGSCIIGSEKGPIAAEKIKIFTYGTSEAYLESPNDVFGAAAEASVIHIRGGNDELKLKVKDNAKVLRYDIM